MTDERKHHDKTRRSVPVGLAAYLSTNAPELAGVEASCEAFGYLRGLHETAAQIEFRFRNGNSRWFAYSWLGTWQYNRSEGLLLRFSGEVVYLVFIRGSNLDKPLKEGSINLTNAGLQRHRVLWIREMSNEEIRQVGEAGPTVDSIEVGICETQEAAREWVASRVPAFR